MQAFKDSLTPVTVDALDNLTAALGNMTPTRSDQLQQVLDAITPIAADIPPTAQPVTDYVTDLETRCGLFQTYRTALTRSELAPSAPMLGYFMVTPIEQLRTFLETFLTVPEQYLFTHLFGINQITPLAIGAILPRGRPSTTSQDSPIHAPPSSILGPPAEANRHKDKGLADTTFTIRAEDPKDVLSWELLELSWNLLRVAAICGAANVTDDEYYFTEEDDDDESAMYYKYVAAMEQEEYDLTVGRDASSYSSRGASQGTGQ
ncbi:hypothetical protein QBC43DRAFT_283289 [Cladorrhinum sp. PSN259]|nr:hypothetical protein QBC43DRAFT_283289 [Cladorrhinum sp. PSN259]